VGLALCKTVKNHRQNRFKFTNLIGKIYMAGGALRCSRIEIGIRIECGAYSDLLIRERNSNARN
jgi:hypothetical protein